jgi:hypothetical protein
MALVVEDGTGLATAESYASVAQLKTYCDNLGLSYSGKTDEQLEQYLRAATRYIEDEFRWATGCKRTSDQALFWPASGACDRYGYAIDTDVVPTVVIQATCQAAFEAFSGDLQPSQGQTVNELAVGPIKLKFDDQATAETTYAKVEGLLRDLVRSADSAMVDLYLV